MNSRKRLRTRCGSRGGIVFRSCRGRDGAVADARDRFGSVGNQCGTVGAIGRGDDTDGVAGPDLL